MMKLYVCLCVTLTFIRPSSNWKTLGLVALAKTAGNSLVLGSTCGEGRVLSYVQKQNQNYLHLFCSQKSDLKMFNDLMYNYVPY